MARRVFRHQGAANHQLHETIAPKIAALGGRRETEHFVIHYANREEIEEDVDLIAGDHELRYAQVARAFEQGANSVSLLLLGPMETLRTNLTRFAREVMPAFQ